MNEIHNALDDLKTSILESRPIDEAITEIAEEYRLSPRFLRNRAEKAFGDLSTLKARATPVVETSKVRRNELTLEVLRGLLFAHNKAHVGQPGWLPDDRLREIIDRANAIGGNLRVATSPIQLKGFRMEPGFVYDDGFVNAVNATSNFPDKIRKAVKANLKEMKRGSLT